MIDITYLDGAKTRKVCILIPTMSLNALTSLLDWGSNFYPVVKLIHNGHELDYQRDLRRCLLLFDEADLTLYCKTKGERKWQKQLQTQHLKQKQKRLGLGRLLGSLVWSMSHTSSYF